MLSSDSEDELPSLSQRIGLSKTTESSKEPINSEETVCRGKNKWPYKGSPLLLVKEYGVTCTEVPSVSSTTVQITSHRYLNPNSAPATTAALIVTACDDAVSTAAEPTRSHTTGTNNCDIITINDSSLTTKDQQLHVQEVNKSVLIVEWLPTGFMVK